MYYRAFWIDATGNPRMSDPLPSFTIAHAYAQAVGGTIERY